MGNMDMDDAASSRPADVDTPEGSAAGDETQSHTPAAKGQNQSAKDRKCQYCQQAFTSSSLGRHLDQFLFKKKPDGIHNVEEIRRIRSGITRRQARTSTGKRDTPERSVGKGQSETQGAGENGKARDGTVRMMFNTPTWHATGVINDIPNPNNPQDTGSSRLAPSQSRTGSMNLPDYASRGTSSQNPDTMRALELALREVLDNIKAATSRLHPPRSPFDFEVQSQTFPSLCLQLLPPPPSLFAASPFPSPSSFPLKPPAAEHLDIVRQAIRAKIAQWQYDQLSTDSTNHSQPGMFGLGLDPNMVARGVQQHEELSLGHLELAFHHWQSLPLEEKQRVWQLEITRAFAREMDKRKSLDEQLARVQQEANQLRAQVERLGSCQWPREFALFPPDTLPLPRDVARELDAKEGQISPHSPRWDYDNVVAKWRRVVLHDKSMGRVGVGYSNSGMDEQQDFNKQPRMADEPNSNSNNRSKPPHGLPSTSSPSPQTGGGPSAPSSQYSPYLHSEASRSPRGGGPQAKRPRLMNGHGGHHNSTDGPSTPPAHANQGGHGHGHSHSHSWSSHHNHNHNQNHHQPLTVSNLAASSGPMPPSPSN